MNRSLCDSQLSREARVLISSSGGGLGPAAGPPWLTLGSDSQPCPRLSHSGDSLGAGLWGSFCKARVTHGPFGIEQLIFLRLTGKAWTRPLSARRPRIPEACGQVQPPEPRTGCDGLRRTSTQTRGRLPVLFSSYQPRLPPTRGPSRPRDATSLFRPATLGPPPRLIRGVLCACSDLGVSFLPQWASSWSWAMARRWTPAPAHSLGCRPGTAQTSPS